MTTKHTPLPWFIDIDDLASVTSEECGVCGTHQPTYDDNGALDAYCREVEEANAALIVRAVNAHNGLVAALEGMLDVCWDMERDDKTIDAVTTARAALAKATDEHAKA